MDKVKVESLISSRVLLSVPELRLKRVWEKKGAVKTIPFETLEEAMFEPGVEALFTNGVLGIPDMETKIRLGLEPEGAEKPENIIALNDQQRKRYMTVMPIGEFKTEVKKLPKDQVEELAQFAIENEIADFEKAEFLKSIIGLDIMSAIKLKRDDKAVQSEE